MDGRGFDALARALGASTGRRAAVLGALAVLWGNRVGRPPKAAAQDGYEGLTLGAPCTSSGECSQWAACMLSTPVYCADNGYADDGPLNCCGWDGGICAAHNECCGGLLCLGEYPTGGCSPGTCQPRESYNVVGAGGSCTETYQCKQDYASLICSTEGRCCSAEPGYRCFMDEECCGGMTCNGVQVGQSCMGCSGWERGYCG